MTSLQQLSGACCRDVHTRARVPVHTSGLCMCVCVHACAERASERAVDRTTPVSFPISSALCFFLLNSHEAVNEKAEGSLGSRGSRAAGCSRSVLSSGLENSLALSARAARPAWRVGPGFSRNSRLPSCGPERSLNLSASLVPSGRHTTAVRGSRVAGNGDHEAGECAECSRGVAL